MAQKPNYDFERKERERLKALKKAARADAKAKVVEDGRDGEKAGPTDQG